MPGNRGGWWLNTASKRELGDEVIGRGQNFVTGRLRVLKLSVREPAEILYIHDTAHPESQTILFC
jgi:hypothetical protein